MAVEDLPSELIAKHVDAHSQRRTFGPADLEELYALLRSADTVLPLADAYSLSPKPQHLIGLRHDMDHDLENAVRLAEVEHEHGFRATYLVLHTDWHYRARPGAGISSYALRGLDRIASLGHEVTLHNNAITVALLADRDPVEVLAEELEELRSHGFECRGTAHHGDPLCRAVGYVNYEVFTECARPNLGEPDRVLSYDDPQTGRHHEVKLRPVPMGELGLDYEASYVHHDFYLSDSGGAWVEPVTEMAARFLSAGGFLQILMHPIWWALQGENYTPKAPRKFALIGEPEPPAAPETGATPETAPQTEFATDTTPGEREELTWLRAENAELRRVNQLLRSTSAQAAGELDLAVLSEAPGLGGARLALFPLDVADARVSLFPFEYHAGLIDLLHDHPDVFNVVTYGDLPWGDDFDWEHSYPDEWKRWHEYATGDGAAKIHVLIQHDIDAAPDHAAALVAYERAKAVRTNVMIFARYLNRYELIRTETVQFEPYGMDLDLLQEAEREGFVIGYHSNAVEQALWDLDEAPKRFYDDVKELRKRFDLKFFSAHGGVSGPGGENNTSISIPPVLQHDIRWVHNKHSMRFNGYYSDGGVLSQNRPPQERDIRDFVRSWQPGCRYRVLTHPQYYASPPTRHPYLNEADWYRDMMDEYESGKRDFWHGVFPDALE